LDDGQLAELLRNCYAIIKLGKLPMSSLRGVKLRLVLLARDAQMPIHQ